MKYECVIAGHNQRFIEVCPKCFSAKTDEIEQLRAERDECAERLKSAHKSLGVQQTELSEARAQLKAARGALADFAHSEDMTLDLLRAKAKRIYDETVES